MKAKGLRFYFSLRSPYSFLGLHRFKQFLPKLDLDYELIAISPPKQITDKPIAAPAKLKYIVQDIERIFQAYGLQLKMPRPFDCKWIIPHAAFLYADQQGKGLEFAYESYVSRFCQGEDISREETLTQLAESCELDANEILQAISNKKYQKELLLNGRKALDDNVFGVPSFIYNDEIFWGNDRFDWLIRKLHEERGIHVSDLSVDVMQRTF